MLWKTMVFWVALCLGPPVLLLAQQTPFVEPGTEVRVYSPVFTRVAIVTSADSDTLTVVTKGHRDSVAIPIDSIHRLEQRLRVGVGKRALQGAKWGALVGAAYGVGGLIMSEGGPGDPPRGWWPLVGVAIFAPPTTLAFMAIPRYRWEPVLLPERVSVSWHGNAIKIAVRLDG